MPNHKKLRVAVVFGGSSSEREVSVNSGKEVLKNLPRNKYQVFPLEISKKSEWLLRLPKNKKIIFTSKNLLGLKNHIDVVFLALHGKFGEDGRIQSLLDKIHLSYTGSGAKASALGMDKLKTRNLAVKIGLKCAKAIQINSKKINLNNLDNLIKQKISYPCVVKPNQSGSSIGVSIIDSKNELKNAIKNAAGEDFVILIEEYVRGREVSCGVLGNSGQSKIKALPVTEIIPRSSDRFFTYQAKYESGRTKEICPAPISKKLADKIQRQSKIIHAALGCGGLTRSDFIIDQDNRLFFLEINTIPGITSTSICPKEAKTAGISFPNFLDLQVQLALSRTKFRTF